MASPADDLLLSAYHSLRTTLAARDPSTVLPAPPALATAHASLPQPSAASYLTPRGTAATLAHIREDLVPALAGHGRAGRYFGFVTGSVLPVAEAADNIASALDQNVAVDLPRESVATAVEEAALGMVAGLLELEPAEWAGIFTTGATASNVMGLAMGRDAVVSAKCLAGGVDPESAQCRVAEMGLVEACKAAGVESIRVLTSQAHSSLAKAASIVGIGRSGVHDVGCRGDEPWRLDVDRVDEMLQLGSKRNIATIIVVSAGEVNAGKYATFKADMERLRALATKYGAWIHVDGAFGIFARALPHTEEFAHLRHCVDGLQLADSITTDGHKLLNVPYDCGIFLSRHRKLQVQVFQNQNAAYLNTDDSSSSAFSPLNMGIENSRRFRALPVYATLLSEGRSGMTDMFVRMVRFAREVNRFLQDCDAYELLPTSNCAVEQTFIIVLFRAKNETLNNALVDTINSTREMYVSGTTWEGKKACRIAVSSWRVDIAKDLPIVKSILMGAAQSRSPKS